MSLANVMIEKNKVTGGSMGNGKKIERTPTP